MPRALVSGCIFCQPDNPDVNTVIAENDLAYARFDNYPLTQGHIEIVPFRHVGSVFDLTDDEARAIWQLMRHTFKSDFTVDGFTFGVNDGAAAGQTVPHMHLHIIPRRVGDVPNPRGGIRNIFPNDTYSQGDC